MKITTSKVAVKAIKEHIARPEQEEVFIISLNSNLEIISIHFVALGDVNATTIPFHIIYKTLCIDLATACILVHTHPSGNTLPSQSDIDCTSRLRSGLITLDISLVDHIIVAKDKFYSFSDEAVATIE